MGSASRDQPAQGEAQAAVLGLGQGVLAETLANPGIDAEPRLDRPFGDDGDQDRQQRDREQYVGGVLRLRRFVLLSRTWLNGMPQK